MKLSITNAVSHIEDKIKDLQSTINELEQQKREWQRIENKLLSTCASIDEATLEAKVLLMHINDMMSKEGNVNGKARNVSKKSETKQNETGRNKSEISK